MPRYYVSVPCGWLEAESPMAAVQRIVADLHESGYIEVFKEGRRNRYEVRFEKNLRHPVERHCTVQDLVQLVVP